jgi:DNA (cytosine-5)-methyltransferase 1
MRHAYYNENNRHAAEWLRKLIKYGLIVDGEVDERSIEDVSPVDIRGFAQCHFFAGIGGWSYALRLVGWPDSEPVWTGSCPCQPFSSIGAKRGFADPRHLWPEWFRLIAECRPVTLFGEQVEGAVAQGWLDRVQADLEGVGYAFGAAVFPAAGVGAPHLRSRLYFMGDSDCLRYSPDVQREDRRADGSPCLGEDAGRLESRLGDDRGPSFWADAEWTCGPDGRARAVKPGIHPLVDGFPLRVACLCAAGNAIVPQQAAEFIGASIEAAALLG